jgi:Cell Wall Hydrolase
MRRHILLGIALLSAAFAAPALAFDAAEPFMASRDPATFDRSLQCLTEAIYYEARGESEDGQRAVAQVVLNRVRHPAYPNTVCGVVYQGSQRTTGCQFSFTCTGVMGAIGDPVSWDRARRIAAAALRGSVYRRVGLATNYHTTAIHPYWAPSLVPQATVGAHIFYRRPDSGSVEAFSQMPGNYEPQTFGRMRGERYEDVRVEQPQYAAPMRERRVPGRDRYAPMQLAEIPVPERRLIYRTYGPRPTAIQASATDGRPAAARQTAVRTGPRVVRQNGVRIIYGN